MSCPGLHCACCSGGSAVPVAILAGALGTDWVLTHLAEVAAAAGTCGVLAIAASVALLRWADRRDERRAVRYALLREARTALPVTAAAVTSGPRKELAGDVHVYHHHYMHGVPEDEHAAIIRNALTEGK